MSERQEAEDRERVVVEFLYRLTSDLEKGSLLSGSTVTGGGRGGSRTGDRRPRSERALDATPRLPVVALSNRTHMSIGSRQYGQSRVVSSGRTRIAPGACASSPR